MGAAEPQAGHDERILHREELWRKDWRSGQHRGPATSLVALPRGGKYASAGKDGTLRVWGRDLRPLQVVDTVPRDALNAGSPPNRGAWASDVACAVMGGHERLVLASMDRSLSFFNVLPAEDDADRPDEHSCLGSAGRLELPAATGPALCLGALPAAAGACGGGGGGAGEQRLAFGTGSGAVCALRCQPPAMATAAAARAATPGVDFSVLHAEHRGWVTQLLHAPEVGLLSSSVDATVKVYDPARGAVTATAGLHAKEVRCMAHSVPLSLVLSGGTERSVLLWHPRGDPNKAVGELAGHVGGAVAVVAAEQHHHQQAFTLAGDGVLSVWDLRMLKALQRVGRGDWADAEDSRPAVMLYDSAAQRLVTATRRPAVWRHGRAAGGERGAAAAGPAACEDAIVPVSTTAHATSDSAREPPAVPPASGHAAAAGEAAACRDGAQQHDISSGGTRGTTAHVPWTEPPLWLRPHSRLHLGSIPAQPGS